MFLHDDLCTHFFISLRFFLIGLLGVLNEVDLWHCFFLQTFAASYFRRDGIIEVNLVDYVY